MNRKKSKTNTLISDDSLIGFRMREANSFCEVLIVLG